MLRVLPASLRPTMSSWPINLGPALFSAQAISPQPHEPLRLMLNTEWPGATLQPRLSGSRASLTTSCALIHLWGTAWSTWGRGGNAHPPTPPPPHPRLIWGLLCGLWNFFFFPTLHIQTSEPSLLSSWLRADAGHVVILIILIRISWLISWNATCDQISHKKGMKAHMPKTCFIFYI